MAGSRGSMAGSEVTAVVSTRWWPRSSRSVRQRRHLLVHHLGHGRAVVGRVRQVIVVTVGDDLVVGQHDHLGLRGGATAARRCTRPPRVETQAGDLLRDPRLGVGVDGRGRLDQDQDRGGGGEGAGQHHALTLTP